MDLDTGIKFCAEVEVCSAKYESSRQNKFKMVVAAILNLVFLAIIWALIKFLHHIWYNDAA